MSIILGNQEIDGLLWYAGSRAWRFSLGNAQRLKAQGAQEARGVAAWREDGIEVLDTRHPYKIRAPRDFGTGVDRKQQVLEFPEVDVYDVRETSQKSPWNGVVFNERALVVNEVAKRRNVSLVLNKAAAAPPVAIRNNNVEVAFSDQNVAYLALKGLILCRDAQPALQKPWTRPFANQLALEMCQTGMPVNVAAASIKTAVACAAAYEIAAFLGDYGDGIYGDADGRPRPVPSQARPLLTRSVKVFDQKTRRVKEEKGFLAEVAHSVAKAIIKEEVRPILFDIGAI